MKLIEKLAIIINKAYAQGIYEAEDLAKYIVKSGISINNNDDDCHW